MSVTKCYSEPVVYTQLMVLEHLLCIHKNDFLCDSPEEKEAIKNYIGVISGDEGINGLRRLAIELGYIIDVAWDELWNEDSDWCEKLLHGDRFDWDGVGDFDWDFVPMCVHNWLLTHSTKILLANTYQESFSIEQMRHYILSIPKGAF